MYSKEITTEFLEKYKEFETIRENDYKRFSYYQHQYPDLFELFRNIRNNLAHNTVDGEYPFIVSEKLFEELNLLVKEMQEKLIERSIHIQNLIHATYNSSVSKIVDIMIKNKFQYIPIMENGKIKHVFSSNVLLAYISDHSYITKDLKMKDIIQYLDIEKFKIYNVNSFTYQVEDLFKKHKINVAFITRHGKDDERILGMITSYEV